MSTKKVKHPAKYTDTFIHEFAEILNGSNTVLDPFAGIGKLALIKEHGFNGRVICNEIETEWTKSEDHPVDEWHIGDAEEMQWAENNSIDAICTSPTYGNRMADHFNAKDGSKRITYRHFLGRPLDENNTGRMQWGKKYRKKHVGVYKECIRVLKNGGKMIINISDHIRGGKQIPVVKWHKETLIELGMNLIDEIQIETPRMGFGANAKARVEYEFILVFRKNL